MKKNQNKNKLTHHEQLQLKQWLAEDWSYSVIIDFLKERFNKEVSQSCLSYYSSHYKDEIDSTRKTINSDVKNVPISSKVVRQRRREKIYQIYFSKGEYARALAVIDDIDKMESPTPDKSGIHIGINNTNTNNNSALSQLSDQELDELSRGIIARRQAVNN